MALSLTLHSSSAGLQHTHRLRKWDARFITREDLHRRKLPVTSTSNKFISISQFVLSNKYERIDGRRHFTISSVSQGQEETQVQVAGEDEEEEQQMTEEEEDAEYVRQILRVVELLKGKRDMTFNEIRLTIMIEDPREAERKSQLGVEDDRGCSRDDMAAALVDVYEGRMPKDHVVLRELAKEMLNWPKLEEEVDKKRNPVASPYAKVTNIGVDPTVAAQRAKIDWDAATEIDAENEKDVGESMPPVVGFSVLYLISSLPVIIGIFVVLILFLNSLQ